MFFPAWIILVGLSLWISIIAFVWALQTGQFSEQARARYLPLIDDTVLPDTETPDKLTLEAYALMVIVALGLVGMLASILLSIYRIG